MRFATYQEVLDYLYNNLPMFQRQGVAAFRKDLSRTLQLDDLLQRPHRHFKSIHIAGTNGKGSTAHMLAAILQKSGYKTGMYTSPHLRNFTERIKINGKEMSPEAVIDFVNRYYEDIQRIKPSFFEITFAMAVEHYKDEEVDIAIIETGMGGRLDSTNVIEPILSVITNVSYDHQQYLGDTLAEIAAEKAGIIKKGVPVVIGEKQKEIAEVFLNTAQAVGAPLCFATDDYQVEKQEQGFTIWEQGKQWEERIYLSLPGNYQRFNLPGVLKAVEVLNGSGDVLLKREDIVSALSEIQERTGLKGRYQVVRKKPKVIADVAHNEAGLTLVMEQLLSEEYEKLLIVLGVVNDKDLTKIWNILPRKAYYFFTQASIPRALSAEDLRTEATANGFIGEVIENVSQAYSRALDTANENDLIFVGGSTFTVAEIEDLYNED